MSVVDIQTMYQRDRKELETSTLLLYNAEDTLLNKSAVTSFEDGTKPDDFHAVIPLMTRITIQQRNSFLRLVFF